jgi:hypothetical protein
MAAKNMIPVRPDALEFIGLRQAMLRTWLPIILVVLIGAAAYLPLQNLQVDFAADGPMGMGSYTDMTYEYTLYQEHYQVDITGIEDRKWDIEDEGMSVSFGVKESYSVSHGDGINHANLDSMKMSTGVVAEEHASNSWWVFLFAFILLLLVLERSSDGWFNRNFPIALEWVAAGAALLIVIFVMIGFGDFFTLGDAAPEALGHVDFDGGLYGESMTEEGEGVLPETASWSPGIVMWLELIILLIAIPLILLHSLEAISTGWWGDSRTSHPKSLFKETPISSLHESDGFSLKNISLASKMPAFASILALILLASALFMPWVEHYQEYRSMDEDGDWSVHQVTWSTGLFGSEFTNSTIFESPSDVESETSDTSENASVVKTEKLVGDMTTRFFLGLTLLLIPLIMTFVPNERRQKMGSSRLWLATGLLLSCWVFSGITSDLASGGKSMSGDASLLRPDENMLIMWIDEGEAGEMGFGQAFVMLQGADWLGVMMETGWSTTLAVSFINIGMILLFLSALVCLTGLHENAGNSSGKLAIIPAAFHGEPLHHGGWLAVPDGGSNKIAFAAIGVLTLITALMGGALKDTFVSTGSSEGPEGKKFDVEIRDDWDDVFTDGNLNNGDSLQFTIDIPATNVENVTYIHFRAGCSDNTGGFGDSNPVGEDTDAIRIEITLPDELGGGILVEEEDCVDNWSFIHDIGDDSSNSANHVVEARTAEAAALRFYGDDKMMVSVDVKVTAITKGSLGGSGVNEDDELYAAFYSTWQGYFSQISEIVEDE